MRKRALIHCIGETEGIVFLEGSGESCHTLDSGIWPQKANESLCLSVLTLCRLGSIVVHAISEHREGMGVPDAASVKWPSRARFGAAEGTRLISPLLNCDLLQLDKCDLLQLVKTHPAESRSCNVTSKVDPSLAAWSVGGSESP
jgi:hypothetical protein